jgi:hypothetical protein
MGDFLEGAEPAGAVFVVVVSNCSSDGGLQGQSQLFANHQLA